MSYEIQIDHKDDEVVSFTINDTPCQVEIEDICTALEQQLNII